MRLVLLVQKVTPVRQAQWLALLVPPVLLVRKVTQVHKVFKAFKVSLVLLVLLQL